MGVLGLLGPSVLALPAPIPCKVHTCCLIGRALSGPGWFHGPLCGILGFILGIPREDPMKDKTTWPLCCLWSGPVFLGQNRLQTEPLPSTVPCAPGLTPVASSLRSNKLMGPRPLPALAGTSARPPWWPEVFWAARLWEVPALLALGTDPEMQTWHPPRAWEAPVSLEQLNQRQGHRLGDSGQRPLLECPLPAFAWFSCPSFLHFSEESRRKASKENRGTNICVERDLETSRWTLRKADGDMTQRSSKPEAGLDRSLGLHSSSRGSSGRVAPVAGLSQDSFPLGDKFGPPALEFLAQPQILLGPSGPEK